MKAAFDAFFSTLVVVRHRGRYLLVEERAEDGRAVWYLPAGGARPGEDFLAVEPVGLLGADQVVADDGRTTKVRLVLLGRVVGDVADLRPGNGAVRAAWFRPAEVRRLSLRHDEVAEWIAVAESRRECPLAKVTCYNRSRPPSHVQAG